MTKIIILTASTGGGHNQAADTLASYYRTSGFEVKIIDFLQVKGRTIERLFVDSYALMYNSLPKMYSKLYSFTNNSLSANICSFILKSFEAEISKIVSEEKPQLVIATHPLINGIVCKLKGKQKITVPFISVITDFKAHTFYLSNHVDAYITASEYTRLDLIRKGIRAHKVYSYGLPIRKEFLEKSPAKAPKSKIFTILVMGGSIGHKAIEDVLRNLVCCSNAVKIIMVCGANKALAERLRNDYPTKIGNKEIDILGYTDQVPVLMDEADLLISKPGGLTVSESISKNLPMIIPFMIPGQEEENAAFLTESGCAKVIGGTDRLYDEVDFLIDNPHSLLTMKQEMHKLHAGYNINHIIALGQDLIAQYYDERLLKSGT